MKTIWKARLSYAQGLGSGVSPAAEGVSYEKALRAVSNHSGGLAPIASGANPVASALGCLARRDPGKAVRTYHAARNSTRKTGTFYVAGIRNFLFGSDMHFAVWRCWPMGASYSLI